MTHALISTPVITRGIPIPVWFTYLEGCFGVRLASSEMKEFGAGGAKVYVLYPYFYFCHAQSSLGVALPGLWPGALLPEATPPPPPPRATPVEANFHTFPKPAPFKGPDLHDVDKARALRWRFKPQFLSLHNGLDWVPQGFQRSLPQRQQLQPIVVFMANSRCMSQNFRHLNKF